MGIKEELLADMAMQQKQQVAKRCATCRALLSLSEAEQEEFDGEILPDLSYTDTSIARWLTDHSKMNVAQSSVNLHRKGDHEYR